MGAKIGERVMAICGMNEEKNVVEVFGSGVRIADAVPPDGVFMVGIDMHKIGHENPCILLDNGEEVFGCECWWGPEESLKKRIEGFKTKVVSISEYREWVKKEMEKEQDGSEE